MSNQSGETDGMIEGERTTLDWVDYGIMSVYTLIINVQFKICGGSTSNEEQLSDPSTDRSCKAARQIFQFKIAKESLDVPS